MSLQKMIQSYAPRCPQEDADRWRMLEALSRFPDVLTRENALCHFTASAWVTNQTRSKVLMVWHKIYRSWSWTGGHADGDANLLRVAVREAKEETGVQKIEPIFDEPISLEILCVPGHVRRGAYVSAHLHYNLTFLLCADDTAALHAKPDENSGVAWFTPDAALEHSSEPEMLPIYKKCNARLYEAR